MLALNRPVRSKACMLFNSQKHLMLITCGLPVVQAIEAMCVDMEVTQKRGQQVLQHQLEVERARTKVGTKKS